MTYATTKMNRYLINFSYIGTRFRGIQRTTRKSEEATESDTKTIQGCVELALRALRPINEIQTVISSRTDAGVHALHTTLHVDLERRDGLPYDCSIATGVLNRTLYKQELPIRIINICHVPSTFHCRYHAKGRTYLYRLAVAKKGIKDYKALSYKTYESFLPIEEWDRCYFLQGADFDIERCMKAAPMFLGLHDFRTFMSVSNGGRDHPMFCIRKITDIQIRSSKSISTGLNAENANNLYSYWDIEISGKSFLYKQVRRIVGTLIALGTDRINEKCIYEMLTIPSKNSWNNRVVPAPAFGLYLCRVHYNIEDLQFDSAPLSSNEKQDNPIIDSQANNNNNESNQKEDEQFPARTIESQTTEIMSN